VSHKQSAPCRKLDRFRPVTAAVLLAGLAAVTLPGQAHAATGSGTSGTVSLGVLTGGNSLSSSLANTAASASVLVQWGDPKTDKASKGLDGSNDPKKDPGSLANITSATGAREAWKSKDAKGRATTGAGVTVALLDTGIDTRVRGLDGAGKVVAGPDLSFEANSPDLTGGDNFGHGTHLAGIIAARDAVAVDGTGLPKPASEDDELGVAPDAKLLAVKVGGRDGSTDVSQVIAGLDWIVQHRNDNGMKVRVVNLSYGTDSAQSYLTDPLAAAAENAWKHGIVVVVSGGNAGASATRLTNPAIDPYVIAVGASDPQGTVGGLKNPKVASFSSRGSTLRHVDLVAPGTSIASLRTPGSYVDEHNPQGRVAGDTSGRLFRGSGSSQAAAVVSGAAALILQAAPELTPDQVKAALVTSAAPIPGASVLDQGAGQLNVAGAVTRARTISTMARTGLAGWTAQSFAPASGLGLLEAARGTSHLTDPDTGLTLAGEVDVQGQPWTPAAWRAAQAADRTWTGGSWNGARWSGDNWSGARWSNAAWTGVRWNGVRWSESSWDAVRWSGVRWTGVRWTDNSWL